MRNSICIVVLLWMFIGNAQSELIAVSVNAQITASHILLQEQLVVQLPDSVRKVRLRTLVFDDAIPKLRMVSVNGAKNNFEEQYEKGLQVVTIFSEDTPIKDITIEYSINKVEDKIVTVPIFFTELPAASSDVGFFDMDMNFHAEQEYSIRFPKVSLTETVNKETKNVRFNIPALPSMIRMQLFSEKKQTITLINSIDWIVALIFMIIGYFIWRNRKYLQYG